MNKKHLIQALLLLVSLAALLGMAAATLWIERGETDALPGFRLSSEDDCITVVWDEVSAVSVQSVELTITSGETVESVSLNPLSVSQYRFTDGVHGERYTVSLSLVYQDGTTSAAQEKSALFLDYDALPQDVPLLEITTEDYEDPQAEYISPTEDGMQGASITNNEPVEGTMVFTEDGKELSAGIELRIRGNTSAYSSKKPYKLTLDEPIDLINGDGNHADKDWVLLAYSGTNLKTFLGNYLAELCGMAWQPQMKFVNLILNGDWKGCYILIESVKRDSMRVDVEKTGYLFENDAYWWNSDGIYFKTNSQGQSFGFTFKYPKITDASDERISELQSYMQEVEDAILSRSASICDYIDVDSWVGWLLCHDLLGHGDLGGTNVYYYINDLSSSDLTERKIYMGPVWDFDGAYATVSDWSYQHSSGALYFSYLLDVEEFREAYENLWNALSPTLLDSIEAALEELYEAQGAGLEASRELDAARWQVTRTSLAEEIESAMAFFTEQIAWMDTQIAAGLE